MRLVRATARPRQRGDRMSRKTKKRVVVIAVIVAVLLTIGTVILISRDSSCREKGKRAAEEFRNEYVTDGSGTEHLYLDEMADLVEEEAYDACLRGR